MTHHSSLIKTNGKNWRGQIMIMSLVLLTIIFILAASLFEQVANFIRFSSRSTINEQAVNLAEAGIDYSIFKLNQQAGNFTGESNVQLGSVGTFSVSVVDKSQSLKTVTATGFVPNSTSPKSKRTIKVDVLASSTTVSFRYAIQVGTGGVDMYNSATINGNVYSNGNIIGSGGGAGGGSSTIVGEAYAVGTISSPHPIITVPPPHPFASPQPLPTFDYQFWKDAATTGSITTCSPTCTINNNTNIGPQKYIGNLEITNNAIVTIQGPVYVTGDFSVSQGGTTLKLDDSFGSNGTVFIIDGIANFTQGGNFQPTNATPKGYISLVTTSTSNQAIRISQSGATAIFYTLEGGAELSQSASVTALVSNTLVMSQNSQLNYDTGLASAQFSTGPGASWQIKRGTYKFTSNP